MTKDTQLGALSQTVSHSVCVGFSLQDMSGKEKAREAEAVHGKLGSVVSLSFFLPAGGTKSLLEHYCFISKKNKWDLVPDLDGISQPLIFYLCIILMLILEIVTVMSVMWK